MRPWRHDQFVIALPEWYARASEHATSAVDLSLFGDEPWVWLRREASPDYRHQFMATCRRAGCAPDATSPGQLDPDTTGRGGLRPRCPALVPKATAARTFQRPVAYRPLTDPAGTVELSLVTRAGSQEALVKECLRVAPEESIGTAHLD